MSLEHRKTMTYKDFKDQFPTEDNISSFKRINRNTFEYIYKNHKRIRLYETDIIIYTDKSMILNSGGFYNNLTKNRLNEAVNGYIYQDKGIWYYKIGDESIRYFDGIEIDRATGKVLNQNTAPAYAKIDEENKAIKKLIKNYCETIKELDKLPEDSSGDCFFCQGMFPENQDNHLMTHLEEKYIMKSLILKALHESGYSNASFIYHIESIDKKKSLVIRAVKKYFEKYLIKKIKL